MALKKIAVLSFAFLLFSVAAVVSFVSPVVAEETIYIRSDGTVEGTDKIQRDGNVYTFTDNIFNQSIIVERDNIVVDGAGYTLQGTGAHALRGIFLLERNNVTIKNVQIRSFRLAIELESSSDNVICGNNITENPVGGIGFWKSSNNTISENYIANSWAGIYLQGSMLITSDHNSIVRNYITNNTRDGITLFGCFNRIAENHIANNGNGIGIRVPPWVSGASNNMVYHNNFVNNTRQIFTERGFMIPDSINIWDNGVEGNYWSDYEERYPNATEIDGSGIWDTPYVIDENNQDNYPLVNPAAIPGLPDITPPTISIVSPENKTYTVNNVSLTFTISEPTSWIGYSLDGQSNVTISGNTTLTELYDGSHTLRVYAKDIAGNTGSSETIHFTIETQKSEPFPTTWIVATITLIAVVGAALLVYFTKTKKTTDKVE